ncbi:MAG: hypothetical protein K9G33_08410 [Sneathiella sp.]|nr:hypothetical protein [Sneathiella sp.]
MNLHQRDQQNDLADFDADALIEESAETAYLHYSGEEEEANDNFPAHEILQGCIWRDTASSQRLAGASDEGMQDDGSYDEGDRRTLDFSDRRRGSRGFLDDETPLYLSGGD